MTAAASPWTPTDREQRAHAELAHLALLAHHLSVLTTVLTSVHAGGGQPEPLTQHARGMIQVVRVLQLQIDAYRQLIGVELPVPRPSSRAGRPRA